MKQRHRPNGSNGSRGPRGGGGGGGNGDPRKAYERYMAMARAAEASGDSVAREQYFQHADHYYRIMNARAQKSEDRSANAPENS